MGTFDIAQICLNGHVITEMANDHPEYRKEFCNDCGEKTIMSCENCKTNIKGYHTIPNVIGFFHYNKPKYCEKCGYPFPWASRQLISAKELIDLTENLNPDDKVELKSSIDELVKEGPKTVLAKAKYKKYISKAGYEFGIGIKEILVDVVSETVKKALWGQ
jgi:hypothetical protein